MHRFSSLLLLPFLCASLLSMSCGGDDVATTPDGLLFVSSESMGANCATGGQRIDVGVDTNGNGGLEDSEITSSSYICSGADGVQGADGAAGSDGSQGDSALVSFTPEAAGANCATGGQLVSWGVDDNADGTLSADEEDGTRFICNGAQGAQGTNMLVIFADEAAGANCASGGQRIDYGQDVDASGVLEAAEITGARYVCNGAQGSDTLTASTPEAAGANCANGGQRVAYGQDADANGTLDSAEVEGIAYLCNGTDGIDGIDGQNALVNVLPEPAGANCADGGQRIDAGADADDNATLDAAEITSTSYVCNGAQGNAGGNALVTLTAEPDGANCANSGQRVDYGTDANGNDTLDAAEIDGTAYVCNGIDA